MCDITVNGHKLFKDELSKEEEEYLFAGGENRTAKRPDILLFPDEGKCIIIEFKTTEVNVSNHLHQINKYAAWIQNYSNDSFRMNAFYGYLIGENIIPGDVLAADPYFQNAYHFDYLYCPYRPVPDIEGNRKGSLYREVIKYSTLLKRAIRRNQIFIDKLCLPKDHVERKVKGVAVI